MKYGLIVLTMLVCLGCSKPGDVTQKEDLSDWVGNYHVTLFSGGQKVGEWDVNQHVLYQNNGFSFTDSKTGKLVRIYGTAVAERR